MTFRHLIVTLAALSALSLRAEEPVRFAFITDNHYSAGSRSITDLRRCIRDINSREDLDFVIKIQNKIRKLITKELPPLNWKNKEE